MQRNGALIVFMLVSLCLVLAGCSKKDEVNTAAMEKSFAASEPTLKGNVDKAVSAIKAGDYAGAMASLQSLAAQAKLTPEQQKAVNDVIAQVKEQLAKMANQAAEQGKKALDDLQKAIPKK